MLNQVEFYNDEDVQKRIAEYCGGVPDDVSSFTAEYIVGYGEALQWKGIERGYVSSPNEGFHWMLNKGLDIFRSVWDKQNTLSILDIEYFNTDAGGDIYLKQKTNFNKIEPVYNLIVDIYKSYGLEPLTIMTGQGYHFSVRIKRNSVADKMLEEIGSISSPLEGKYLTSTGRRHRFVSPLHGKCFDGMGRVLEYLNHKIIIEGSKVSPIPIATTDTAIGKSQNGVREAISLDLSMYGDPIYMRDVRCPFSTHQKHKLMRWKVGDYIADTIPVQISLPRNNESLDNLFEMRRHFRNAANYAKSITCKIPNATDNFIKLIEDYKNSDLYKFHRYFDSTNQENWWDWHKTYDKYNPNELPPCVAHALKDPNPNLLKPTNIESLTRVLLSKGWHPQHIAGLIRSKYERNYGWEEDWTRYDATTRAMFYVRLLAGKIATGIDELLDFNCVSHSEKGYCWKPWCGFNLADYKIDRKKLLI